MANKKLLKKIFSAFLIGIISLFTYINNETNIPDNAPSTKQVTKQKNNTVEKAFSSQKSDVQVIGLGKVVKVLRDDLKGHKHQKFILRLDSGNSILIAHNIDLAPRISNLKKDDEVKFYGEYEYNSRGGVVHWTHHDPKHKHIDGWLKHNQITYK